MRPRSKLLMRAALAALVLMGLAALVLVAASDGEDAAPGARPAPQAGGKLPVRAIFDRDSSPTGFDDQAAIGFTTFDSGPWPEEMDPLAARGVRGFVWLGGYSNESCR